MDKKTPTKPTQIESIAPTRELKQVKPEPFTTPPRPIKPTAFITPPPQQSSGREVPKLQMSEPRPKPQPLFLSRKPLTPFRKILSNDLQANILNLKALLKQYKNKLTKSQREMFDDQGKVIRRNIAIMANLCIYNDARGFISDPDIQSNIKTIIKCLNSLNFIKRFKIINLLKLILDFNEEKNEPWKQIRNYIEIMQQLSFEENLSKLGIEHIPLILPNHYPTERAKKTRIIFTDIAESSSGFEYLFEWCKHYNDGIISIFQLKSVGPAKIKADMGALGIKYCDFELAWGHIMNQGRHMDEDIVFVSNIEALAHAVKHCTTHSTFVLDAHGGAGQLWVGRKKLKGQELTRHIDKIVELLNHKIVHVILSICMTGMINKEVLEGTYMTMSKYPMDIDEMPKSNLEEDELPEINYRRLHKNRTKIFLPDTSEASIRSVFAPMERDQMSLAAYVTHLVLSREKQHSKHGTCVTFSPSVMFPDNKFGGVINVPAVENRALEWPEYVGDWHQDQRVEMGFSKKQIVPRFSLYNKIENPKAVAYDSSIVADIEPKASLSKLLI